MRAEGGHTDARYIADLDAGGRTKGAMVSGTWKSMREDSSGALGTDAALLTPRLRPKETPGRPPTHGTVR